MTESLSFMNLLRWGNAEGIIFALENLSPQERVSALKPLTAVAKKMLTSAAGDFNSDWDGPLSSGHSRSANIILFPTISELKKKIPTDEKFIETDIYTLFPHQLGQIMRAWTHLFAKQLKNYDLQAYLSYAYKWWDYTDVKIAFDAEFTMTTLHTLTAPQLLEFCLMHEEFAYNLFSAAFHQAPPPKMINLEQIDGGILHSDSIAGLVIPTLIHVGTLKQEEVLAWCEYALEMPERKNSDLAWFRRVKKFLKNNELSRLSNPTPRYYLEPYPQLVNIYREITAGLQHPEITADSELETLLPLLDFFEHSTWGGIIICVQSFWLAEEEQTIDRAIKALKFFGFLQAAEVADAANTHWLASHKSVILRNQVPSDETYSQDEKLELEWNEHFPQLQNFIEEKVAHYAKVLALPQP
ncbi:MAG: hypothetical protein SPG61_06790 [Arcanobacterium sp.]|nr:hypothetical protein [Arcanobacterium sp.]